MLLEALVLVLHNSIAALDVNGTAFTTTVGIGTQIALKTLHVQGQAYISSNVGIGTTIAKKTLDVQRRH